MAVLNINASNLLNEFDVVQRGVTFEDFVLYFSSCEGEDLEDYQEEELGVDTDEDYATPELSQSVPQELEEDDTLGGFAELDEPNELEDDKMDNVEEIENLPISKVAEHVGTIEHTLNPIESKGLTAVEKRLAAVTEVKPNDTIEIQSKYHGESVDELEKRVRRLAVKGEPLNMVSSKTLTVDEVPDVPLDEFIKQRGGDIPLGSVLPYYSEKAIEKASISSDIIIYENIKEGCKYVCV